MKSETIPPAPYKAAATAAAFEAAVAAADPPLEAAPAPPDAPAVVPAEVLAVDAAFFPRLDAILYPRIPNVPTCPTIDAPRFLLLAYISGYRLYPGLTEKLESPSPLLG